MRFREVVVGLVLTAGPVGVVAAQPDPDCDKDLKVQVSPKDGQDVDEGVVVTLNGQSSKGDTFAWTQVSGDPVVSLTDADHEKATFVAPAVGPGGATLTFRLTATLAECPAPATIETSIRIQNVNRAPVAATSVAPLTIFEGDAFTLNGSGSSDPDGDPLSYAWDQRVGGTWVPLSTAASVTLTAPEVPYPNGATLTFRLTVSDGALSSVREQLVNVLWLNAAPTAVAECTPAVVDERADLLLDGGRSTDDDDGLATFEWVQLTGGPLAAAPWPVSSSAFSVDAPSLVQGHGDTMRFGLTVTDYAGLSASDECTVRVRDITPPELTLPPSPITVEATGPAGAAASYAASAIDAYDGAVTAACTPGSGGTFALGATTVVCEAFDAAGNRGSGSFLVEVVDTTPPTIAPLANLTVEATSAAGATASWTASATDLVDGSVPVTCAPASGSLFALDATTPVECSATDAHGNRQTASFTVAVVDTTGPTVTPPADVTTGPTQWNGAIVSYGAASAQDLVDGSLPAECSPASGSLFGFGPNVVTCTATDAHGNGGTATFTITVAPFTFLGYFQPVDNAVTNTVKGGATVPVKWKLLGEGGLVITDIRAVRSTKAQSVACGSMPGTEDVIEVTMTGGTVLRYDFTGQQFIFNWQTPKLPGTCWRLDVTFTDETTKSANFKLK
jgi:hypothetical protein